MADGNQFYKVLRNAGFYPMGGKLLIVKVEMGLDSILDVSGPALLIRVCFRLDTHKPSFLYHSSFFCFLAFKKTKQCL